MEHGILLSGADNIDFMIHGVFKYSFFGHEVWITTTHVCVLIVMLLIIGFAIAANRQMAKAREVPEGFQNVVELIVEKLDAMVDTPMGKAAPKFYNYIGTIFIFILVSNISGLLGLRPPHSGLRRDIASRCSDLPADPLQSVQVPEAEGNLGRHVFPAAPLAADLAAH